MSPPTGTPAKLACSPFWPLSSRTTSTLVFAIGVSTPALYSSTSRMLAVSPLTRTVTVPGGGAFTVDAS